ncbi:heme ABC transporter ATP-binding protein [Mucilaginibacter gynuensis]|uniref:Heme ABC transporter ATP-binding protein n=1 Tax=Mucilaginibacter gynuensis TaxID=1302236 RepID=A0ABP8GEY9_9SPHI
MLEVKEICYEVNGRKIIKNVSLFAKRGQMLAIVGANGAGKSTLLSLLNAENKPSSGVVTLDGRSMSDFDPLELAQKRATLAQSHHVNLAFSVEEIVMMGRYPHEKQQAREQDQRIVSETLRICGLKDFGERSYLQLSGGEQQRVHLARVLAQIWDQPEAVLFLDEPVAGLDMRYQQQTLAIAKALCKKGMMVIAVLHDLNLVADYADRVLMLKDGRRWKYGTPIEVLNTLDIYHVFDVETEIKINPKTLSPLVLTKPIKINHSELN